MTTLRDIGGEEFVSLTTYRGNGAPVSVAVWIALDHDDDTLLITTTKRSGKVKRLRRDPRVALRPCARRGEVAPDAPTVLGTAEIVENPHEVRRLREAIRVKYGERMKRTAADEDPPGAAAEDEPTRVILRITARDPDPHAGPGADPHAGPGPGANADPNPDPNPDPNSNPGSHPHPEDTHA